jgi:hypothetical protein
MRVPSSGRPSLRKVGGGPFIVVVGLLRLGLCLAGQVGGDGASRLGSRRAVVRSRESAQLSDERLWKSAREVPGAGRGFDVLVHGRKVAHATTDVCASRHP